MARWLVNQQDRQFAAQDMDELKKLVSDGTISPYDMLQPPGATDWLYICEVDGLKELAQEPEEEEEDISFRKKRSFPIPLPLILLAIAAGFGFLSFKNYETYKSVDGKRVFGDGLALSELVVLRDGTEVYDVPEGNVVGTLSRDQIIGLLGKRIVTKETQKEYWYETQLPTSKGFVHSSKVEAGFYLADPSTSDLYKQLYNPDQFIEVANTAWTRLDPNNPEQTTLGLMVTNNSVFNMTDLVVLTTLSDKNNKVVQKDELRVEGIIPAKKTVWVGMLSPNANSEEETRIMTDFHYKDLVSNEDTTLEGWTFTETLNMLVEETGTVSGRIDLIQMRSIPNPELMK
jgi:hypothetical protein